MFDIVSAVSPSINVRVLVVLALIVACAFAVLVAVGAVAAPDAQACANVIRRTARPACF